MIHILQELFPSNIAYTVLCYLGRHHLAGMVNSQIHNEGQFKVIRYDTCKHHVSRHREYELSSHYWNRIVIENII